MLPDRARIATAVMELVSGARQTPRDQVVFSIFDKQTKDFMAIAPFQINQEGVLMSPVVDEVIDDLIARNYLRGDSKLRRTSLSSPYDNLPRMNIGLASPALPRTFEVTQKKSTIVLGGREYLVERLASAQTRRFASLLPVNPDIGAFFLMSPENPCFEAGVPLFSTGRKISEDFIVSAEEPPKLESIRTRKNLSSMKSFGHSLLGNSFSETRMEEMGRIIFLDMLPISSVRIQLLCERGHRIDGEYSMSSGPILPARCPKCYHEIVHVFYNCINERVMVEWKLGTLSEWLIAAAFKKAGFPNYFWNVSLDGEQCDVLVVDDKRLFIVECKRSHSIDSQFKEGIVKLKTLAELLKPTNIEVIKILFTCINSKVESPEGIDLVVDKSNYSSFVNNPCSLV